MSASTRPQKVNVRAIQTRKTKSGKSHLVKWTVDGRDFTRSRPNGTQAERLRRQLLNAVDAGDRFDPSTGEPVSWSAGETVLDYAGRWYARHWTSWLAKTRDGHREVLPTVVLALTNKPCPDPYRAPLVSWLRATVCAKPGADTSKVAEPREAARWLRAHSLPVQDIDTEITDRVLDTFAVRLDGKPAAVNYQNKRRATFSKLLRTAVADRLLAGNPLETTTRKRRTTSMAVDKRKTMSTSEAHWFLCGLATISPQARRLVAPLATMLYAGARPAEVNGVTLDDLDLPESGWGRAEFSSTIVDVSPEATDDGSGQAEGDLKWRAPGDVRPVPLHPMLVAIIRTHIELFGVHDDGRVFTTESGGLPSEAWHDTWDIARRRMGLTGRMAETVPYDLRHTCGTTWLNGGVQIPVVAERLGHSPEILLRIYANVMTSDDAVANARIEAALAAAF